MENKMFCLRCGKPIESGYWHKRCIKDFFTSDTLPDINLVPSELEKLALEEINDKKDVTGVQEKLSLHLDLSNKKRPRLTNTGFPIEYFLKPQSPTYEQLPEFEQTAMLLAEACSIPVVKHGLIPINGNELAYITKRIDRDKDKKIHMEDFCQATGNLTSNKYRSSYEECGELIKNNSKNPYLDKIKLFTCLYFSFVIANSDLHLKNFSFIMDEDGLLSLSPFYDLLPTKVILPNDHEDLGMLLNGKKYDLHKKDFDTFAKSIDIPINITNAIMKQINDRYEIMSEIIDNSLLNQNSKTVWKRMIKANIRRAS